VKTRGKGCFAAHGDEVVGRGQGKQFSQSIKCPIKMDAFEGDETGGVAHLGALLGFWPSTIQSCLPCLQRLQMFSPGGE